MTVIDADAHVIENESTWDYMLESGRQFRPKVVSATSTKDPFDYWMVDGRVIPRNNVGRDLPVDGGHREKRTDAFPLGARAAAAEHGASPGRAEVRQGEWRLRCLHAWPG